MMVMFPSPFILRPIHAFQDVENLYLTSDFIAGGDLGSIMKYHQFTEA
jgi:hypothetical protein